MNNLHLEISDKDKYLEDPLSFDSKERLNKFEGNYLEIGSYLIPFFKVPFLQTINAKIEADVNIGVSHRNKVRIDYVSEEYSGIREITNKGLFMKIDTQEGNLAKVLKRVTKLI